MGQLAARRRRPCTAVARGTPSSRPPSTDDPRPGDDYDDGISRQRHRSLTPGSSSRSTGPRCGPGVPPGACTPPLGGHAPPNPAGRACRTARDRGRNLARRPRLLGVSCAPAGSATNRPPARDTPTRRPTRTETSSPHSCPSSTSARRGVWPTTELCAGQLITIPSALLPGLLDEHLDVAVGARIVDGRDPDGAQSSPMKTRIQGLTWRSGRPGEAARPPEQGRAVPNPSGRCWTMPATPGVTRGSRASGAPATRSSHASDARIRGEPDSLHNSRAVRAVQRRARWCAGGTASLTCTDVPVLGGSVTYSDFSPRTLAISRGQAGPRTQASKII